MPYLRVANVQDGYVDTNDIAVLRVSKDEIEKYSLSAGEVLMTEGGDRDKLGRGCVWDGRITPCLHPGNHNTSSVRSFHCLGRVKINSTVKGLHVFSGKSMAVFVIGSGKINRSVSYMEFQPLRHHSIGLTTRTCFPSREKKSGHSHIQPSFCSWNQ